MWKTPSTTLGPFSSWIRELMLMVFHILCFKNSNNGVEIFTGILFIFIYLFIYLFIYFFFIYLFIYLFILFIFVLIWNDNTMNFTVLPVKNKWKLWLQQKWVEGHLGVIWVHWLFKFLKNGHSIHLICCISMVLGDNDLSAELHMWPKQKCTKFT